MAEMNLYRCTAAFADRIPRILKRNGFCFTAEYKFESQVNAEDLLVPYQMKIKKYSAEVVVAAGPDDVLHAPEDPITAARLYIVPQSTWCSWYFWRSRHRNLLLALYIERILFAEGGSEIEVFPGMSTFDEWLKTG